MYHTYTVFDALILSMYHNIPMTKMGFNPRRLGTFQLLSLAVSRLWFFAFVFVFKFFNKKSRGMPV